MTDESPSSPTGGGGEKRLTIRETIRSLSYWPEIEHRLVTGESLRGTVKLIQDRGDLDNQYPTTVLKVLDKMRLVLRRPETLDLEPGSQRLEGTPKPGELQFELQRLERLYQMQMGRVKVDRAIEKKLKKLLSSVGRGAETAVPRFEVASGSRCKAAGFGDSAAVHCVERRKGTRGGEASGSEPPRVI